MPIDLKNRPTWKQIAETEEPLAGTDEQFKNNYLKAIEFASTQTRREVGANLGELTVIEQAALKLAQGLKPTVALRLAETTETRLREAALYKNHKPDFHVVDLCRQNALERWREEVSYTRAPKPASPSISEFAQKLSAASLTQPGQNL